MNTNRIEYFQDIILSQLNLAERTGIKNLVPATTVLIISQSSSSRIQTYVNIKRFFKCFSLQTYLQAI